MIIKYYEIIKFILNYFIIYLFIYSHGRNLKFKNIIKDVISTLYKSGVIPDPKNPEFLKSDKYHFLIFS